MQSGRLVCEHKCDRRNGQSSSIGSIDWCSLRDNNNHYCTGASDRRLGSGSSLQLSCTISDRDREESKDAQSLRWVGQSYVNQPVEAALSLRQYRYNVARIGDGQWPASNISLASRFISHPIHRRHWRKPAHRDSRSCSPRGCTSPVRARPAVFSHVKHRFFLLPPPPPMGCARVSDETHRGMWEAAEAEAISTARLSPSAVRASCSALTECRRHGDKVPTNEGTARPTPRWHSCSLTVSQQEMESAVTRGVVIDIESKPRSQTSRRKNDDESARINNEKD